MKCFNHNDKEAIGVCKNCGKSLCGDCYIEVGDSLSCKNLSCENKVKILNSMMDKSIESLYRLNSVMNSESKIYDKSGKNNVNMGIILVILGAIGLLPCFIFKFSLEIFCSSIFSIGAGIIFINYGRKLTKHSQNYNQNESCKVE